MSEVPKIVVSRGDQLLQATTRRRFLSVLGVGGTIALLPGVFAARPFQKGMTGSLTATPNGGALKAATREGYTLDLSTDAGILNYAYALEQLEAAYYTAALTSPGFDQLSLAEQEVFRDLQKHEVFHREFL